MIVSFPHARFFKHEDAVDARRFLTGIRLDDRLIRVDLDWGFEEGRHNYLMLIYLKQTIWTREVRISGIIMVAVCL